MIQKFLKPPNATPIDNVHSIHDPDRDIRKLYMKKLKAPLGRIAMRPGQSVMGSKSDGSADE
jgi:hypothetical protein